MIAQIVTSLALVCFASLWKTKARYDTLFSLLLTLIFASAFGFYADAWQSGYESTYSILWDSTRSGDVSLSINSDLAVYTQVFPFFAISLIALFNNFLFRYETKKKNLAVFIILNFISLVMLITSQNFIQLITFVFIIDMLSQFLIRDINAGRRYAMYNLTADMGLFLAFAVLRGNMLNLNLSALGESVVPFHNFVAVVILLSLCIKFGFFIFHSFLLDLKSAKFHRFFLVFYLSSPMTALILTAKLLPVLRQFEPLYLIINIIIALSLIWGTIGAILIRDLKEKTVYLNMMLFSLLFKLLTYPDFIWDESFSCIIIAAFMFNLCLYYIHYFWFRETNALIVNKVHYVNPLPLYLLLAIWMALWAVVAMLLFAYTDRYTAFIMTFMVLFSLAGAWVFIQALQSDNIIKSLRTDYDHRPLWILAAVLTSGMGIMFWQNLYWYAALPALALFLMFFILSPIGFILNTNTTSLKWQHADVFKNIYDKILARPLQIIGKSLTIFVDFMFFEKTLILIINTFSGLTVRIFRRISRENALRYLLSVLITVFLLFWFLTRGLNG